MEKGSKTITPALRKRIWELFVGIGVKVTTCPLCGIQEIYGFGQNSGFQSCHVVADKYMPSGCLNEFYLYPGCASCNNECADLCLLDYLFVRGRYTQLRKMIRSIYLAFIMVNADTLSNFEGLAWKILDHLYGKRRFMAGGGIQNNMIYEFARTEQMNYIREEKLAKLYTEMEYYAKLLNAVMEGEIKPMIL